MVTVRNSAIMAAERALEDLRDRRVVMAFTVMGSYLKTASSKLTTRSILTFCRRRSVSTVLLEIVEVSGL
jgi:hypothetical protein